jgi:hypothetical protein
MGMDRLRESSCVFEAIHEALEDRPRATMRPHSAVARLAAPDILDRSGGRATRRQEREALNQRQCS